MESPGLNGSLNLTYDNISPQERSNFLLRFQEQYDTIQVLGPLWPPIIVFGFISNIVNIIVFLKSGTNDNVGVLLISLAVSDLTFLTLITPTVCGFLIVTFARSYPWPFDYRLIAYLLYWRAYTVYDLSTYISVSLGVMRCACVAMPLKFKLIFTKSRTIIWVLFLVVLTVSLRMSVLIMHSIGWKTDPSTNKSVPYMFQVNYDSMSRVNDIFNRGLLIYLSFLTMIICVCVLSLKLYQAAQIRRSCTAGGSQPPGQTSDKTVTKTMSTKDLQVVKSVVLVCTIFILAQLPFVTASMIRLVDSEFDFGDRLLRVYSIFGQISRTCSYLNVSINIFVYYNYNSKYRATFNSMFCANIRE